MAQRIVVTDENFDEAVASILDYESSEEESDDEVQPQDNSNFIQCGGLCFNKHPPEGIARCEGGHSFCLEDAKQYTQSQLGKGVAILKCMDPSCKKIFPGTEVLRFIDLEIFAGFPKERLEIMIARVGVTELVEICPYCVIVVTCGTIERTTAVECTNPECERSSCRKCKKGSHGNKTCAEGHKESNECGHCLLRFILEEIVRCEEGHPFLLEAAKEYAQGQLGKGVLVLNCLDPACDKIFPGKEALRFIDLKVFVGLAQERLEIMIASVGVADLLVVCPYCVTVVVSGPIEEITVINCTNLECKKTSCRECQKEDHGAVSCEGFEQSKQEAPSKEKDWRDSIRITIEELITDAIQRDFARVEIERMLTDAIVRGCNVCDLRLLKKNGCNKLVCGQCKNTQCYLCSENITGHDHFEKVNANGGICQELDRDTQPQEVIQEVPGREPEEPWGVYQVIGAGQAQPVVPKLPPIQTEQLVPADKDEDSDIQSPGDWA